MSYRIEKHNSTGHKCSTTYRIQEHKSTGHKNISKEEATECRSTTEQSQEHNCIDTEYRSTKEVQATEHKSYTVEEAHKWT